MEQGKKINQNVNSNKNSQYQKDLETSKAEETEDIKFEGVLVKRPPKGFVWGMGNQSNKKKCNLYALNNPTYVYSMIKNLI